MNAIFNTLLRANFRCGRMSHFRAVQHARDSSYCISSQLGKFLYRLQVSTPGNQTHAENAGIPGVFSIESFRTV